MCDVCARDPTHREHAPALASDDKTEPRPGVLRSRRECTYSQHRDA